MNGHDSTSSEKRTQVTMHCGVRRNKYPCFVIKTQAGHCDISFRGRHSCVDVTLLKQVLRDLQLEYI